LHGSQCLELLRRRMEFELSGQRRFHRTGVLHFTAIVKRSMLMNRKDGHGDPDAPSPNKDSAFLPAHECGGLLPRLVKL
jgi:hypothetical protein